MTKFWLLVIVLTGSVSLVSSAKAEDVAERLVRIEAYAQQTRLGCGTGYLSSTGAIVTAFHVLVPPGSTVCEGPTSALGGATRDITRYVVTREGGPRIEVSCGDIAVLPVQDIGFLRIAGHKAAVLRVQEERVDGFVSSEELRVSSEGTLVGYLDSQCLAQGTLSPNEQNVTLSPARSINWLRHRGDFIAIARPESPGNSGSPVVWRPTGRVIGIYVGEDTVQPGSPARQGIIASFDSAATRRDYQQLTGFALERQRWVPARLYIGVVLLVERQLSGTGMAYGSQLSISKELLVHTNWSIGFGGALGYLYEPYEQSYESPIGTVLETEERVFHSVVIDPALELHLLRNYGAHIRLAAGGRLALPIAHHPPGGLDPSEVAYGGFLQVGTDIRLVEKLWLDISVAVHYGVGPNRTAAYTGRGSELEYPDGEDTTTALRGASRVGVRW